MSCYTRQLGEFLTPFPTAEDKRKLDGAVRVYLEMQDSHCPQVWVAVRERREEPAFANALRAAMRENS